MAIKIDESSMVEAPTFILRFKNALGSTILGIVLVQMYLFASTFIGGNFGLGISVVRFMDNVYFISFLGICALMGCFAGQTFIPWLEDQIGYLKFW